MKIWSMDSSGRVNLKLKDVDVPTPGAGEILVRVANAALNYRDIPFIDAAGVAVYPFTPGDDAAGTVVAVGTGVRRFAIGDRVMTATFHPGHIDGRPKRLPLAPGEKPSGGPLGGAFREYMCISEDLWVKAPASLTDAQACTVPISGVTSWYALIEMGKLKAGETVVVQGTGGAALYGIQIAKAHGARVIVTSSDDDKIGRAKALGADIGINRNRGDWAQAVLEATDGEGADHILEIAGGPNLAKSVEASAEGGQISLIGFLEGSKLDASSWPIMSKQIVIRGIHCGHRRAVEELSRAIDKIGLKPVIDTRYPFSELHAALKHLERGPFGKIVIDV